YTTTQKAIEDAINAKLQELSESLNLISEEIRNIFCLPETFFKELPQLPETPYDLPIEMKYAFPMRTRSQLQQLHYH
ncbi:928_t:CDS:2, partial [Scutellospora calospora]